MPWGRAAALCWRCVGFGVFCALDAAAWALVCAPELWICDLLLNVGPLPTATFLGGGRRGCCGTPPGDGSRCPAALCSRKVAPAQGRAAGRILVLCWREAEGPNAHSATALGTDVALCLK